MQSLVCCIDRLNPRPKAGILGCCSITVIRRTATPVSVIPPKIQVPSPAIVTLAYGTGLRANEVIWLKSPTSTVNA